MKEWIAELTEEDCEVWHHHIECDTKEKIIEEGMKNAKKDRIKSFRIGRAIPCGIPCIDVDFILENAREQLYDEVGESSDVYLDDATEEQIEELDEQLNEVFYQWHKKYNLEPSCYKVVDDEVIEVE